MQLDWLTVAAQIVNFLVLVWLLKRFLYAPITLAMARREARIEQRLAEARAAREEAEAEAAALRARRDEIEAEREAVLDAARHEAAELRDRLAALAEEDAAEARRAWAARLEDERAELLQGLRRRAGQHATELVRRILSDFAGQDLAEGLAAAFAERLAGLGDATRARLAQAAADGPDAALVESGVALPSPVRAQVTRAIHQQLRDGVAVEYRTDPGVVLGLRLTIGDQTLEWSAARHLDRFETAMTEDLEAAAAPAAAGRG